MCNLPTQNENQDTTTRWIAFEKLQRIYTAVTDPADRIQDLKDKVRDAMERDVRERSEEANRLEAELRELLARAMRNIDDPIDRQVLLLWSKGQTHPRIAAQLAMSEEAVKKRWQRIREAMRRELSTERRNANDA